MIYILMHEAEMLSCCHSIVPGKVPVGCDDRVAVRLARHHVASGAEPSIESHAPGVEESVRVSNVVLPRQY
jgi:hypothetical protein